MVTKAASTATAASPSLDDLLNGLFGNDDTSGAAPPAAAALPQAAQPGGLAQIMPGFTDPSTLRLPQLQGAANQNGPGLGAQPPPGMTGGPPQAAPGGALPQLPISAPTGPAPTAPVHSWLVNAIDKGILGGGIATHDAQAQNRASAAYQYARMQDFAQGLAPIQQRQFWGDPQGFMTTYMENLKRANLKQGETSFDPMDPTLSYSAPQWDEKTGKWVRPVAGAGDTLGLAQSPSAGGDYSIQDHTVISGRSGPTGATVTQSQPLTAEQRPQTFQPAVVGGPAPAAAALPVTGAPGPTPAATALPGAGPAAPVGGSLPQRPAAPGVVPPGMPTPGQALAVIPGSTLTSGYRTPAHNAEVGGVPNSWHTVGTPDRPGGLDITPPPGVSLDQAGATLAKQYPGARIINEGDHIHVQPNQRNAPAPAPADTVATSAAAGPAATQQTAPGWSGPGPTAKYGPKYFDAQTNQWRQHNNITNQEEAIGEAGFKAQSAKQEFISSEPFKNYAQANDGFKAMVAAAALHPGGMRAYALRDTFARVINPGAVARVGTIQAIKEAQGLPDNIRAYLMNLTGDGDVPPQVAQQILDVARGFLAAHHSTADAINNANGDQAERFHQNRLDATVPIDAVPGNVHLQLPDRKSLMQGDIYVTPKGLMTWTGTGFNHYAG